MKDKVIVLQIKDSDVNIWCDVEQDDEILDKSELKVIFAPSTLEYNLNYNNSEVNLKTKDEPIDIEILEKDEFDSSGAVNILYTEPLIEVEQTQPQVNIETINNTTLQNVSSNLTPLNFSTGEKSITLSTPLPVLTFDLKQRIEKFGVLAAHKRLIHHYGSYLWEITAGRPTKRDYQNLADNIVREFPLLVSNAGDSVC
ncbi:hypothetical protein PV328_007701 [Microctonus aethiopoides]|uniref:Uncharacterized protein n=1 Tax=Microctonus aethiopoides TaxID=144406 RepID=A0AA39F1I7_9HYME|nr:hypothetical protein PV328_007701 [Microctonus aethiopoides]